MHPNAATQSGETIERHDGQSIGSQNTKRKQCKNKRTEVAENSPNLLEFVVWLHFDALPADDAWLHLVDDLEQHQAVLAVVVQVVDIDAINAQRVDPHAERTLL